MYVPTIVHTSYFWAYFKFYTQGNKYPLGGFLSFSNRITQKVYFIILRHKRVLKVFAFSRPKSNIETYKYSSDHFGAKIQISEQLCKDAN